MILSCQEFALFYFFISFLKRKEISLYEHPKSERMNTIEYIRRFMFKLRINI